MVAKAACARVMKTFLFLQVLLHTRENMNVFISLGGDYKYGCMVWIEKSVTRVIDRHHEACLVMPNSDPE